MPLDEREAIQTAYLEEIGNAFGFFVENTIAQTEGAFEKFVAGVEIVQACRERALEVFNQTGEK